MGCSQSSGGRDVNNSTGPSTWTAAKGRDEPEHSPLSPSRNSNDSASTALLSQDEGALEMSPQGASVDGVGESPPTEMKGLAEAEALEGEDMEPLEEKDPMLEEHFQAAQSIESGTVKPAETPAEASWCKLYFMKFAGAGVSGPPRPPLSQTAVSFFGSFTGIAVLGLIHSFLLPKMTFAPVHLVALVGSFGAMAVLVFSAFKAPLAQPKNVILGNAIGAIVGVTVVKAMELFGLSYAVWLSGALAVSLTIVMQELTTSVHPPGGATALLYVIIPPLQALGYIYVLCPALLGAVLMVVIGVLSNNLSEARTYPQTWGFQRETPAEAESGAFVRYLRKGLGAGVAPPPRPPLSETGFSFLGSFIGIAALGLIDSHILPLVTFHHFVILIGSFGAMAVLVFSQPKAPLGQPKNAILGNTIGGLVGVVVVKVMEFAELGHMLWLTGALCVSLTIAAQELTTSVHPPGGATALIFAIRTCGKPAPLQHSVVISQIGNWYVLCPAFAGAVVLVAVGLATNNLSKMRSYPQGWW